MKPIAEPGKRRPGVPLAARGLLHPIDISGMDAIVLPICKDQGFTIEEIRDHELTCKSACNLRLHIMARLYAQGWSMKEVATYMNRTHAMVHRALDHYPEARAAHEKANDLARKFPLNLPAHLRSQN